jgi:transcriptional regulator with XRE-family HTH domain
MLTITEEYATYPSSVNAAYSTAESALTVAVKVRPVDKHDPEDKKSLGRRLAACREVKGWKQDFAAKQLGVTKAALSAWETGRNMPDALFLKKIAKLYDVSVDAILWENALSNDSMRFAAQFDALSERQRQTLTTVLMAFVQEGVSDARMVETYGRAQERERKADQERLAAMKIGPHDPNERRQLVSYHDPERRADHLVQSPLTHNRRAGDQKKGAA